MLPEELFERLLSGQISRDEFEDFLDGLDDEDTLARYEIFMEEQFLREIEANTTISRPEVKHPAKLKVLRNDGYPERGINFYKSHKKRFSVAAAIVLLAGVLLSGWFILTQFKATERYRQRLAILSQRIQIITKSTPRGRMFRMKMHDGSLVHLNAQSQISYPSRFDSSSRVVEISGEAYFDVARDEQRPFIIKVKDYQVEVLGTSFNIDAYDNEFSVTVESGVVKVNLDKKGVNTATLTKNQKLIYDPASDKMEIMKVNPEIDLSWREGILRFDKTPIAKVEKMIERWYGVDVIISDREIYGKTLTGIHQNKSLKSVLEALTYATESKYKIKDQTIIIKLKEKQTDKVQ